MNKEDNMQDDPLELAIVVALTAHRGQRDKGGQPYILHPLRVMLACSPGERLFG